MNNFTFPVRDAQDISPNYPPYTGLRPGHHRARTKEIPNDMVSQISNETLNQPNVETTRVKTRSEYIAQFTRCLENMEQEINEIKLIQARCKVLQELKPNDEPMDYLFLKAKYSEIIANTKRAPPETATKCVTIKNLLQQLKPEEEFVLKNGEFKIIKKAKEQNPHSTQALQEIVMLVFNSLKNGISSFDNMIIISEDRITKETFIILEILILAGLTEWGRQLICNSKEIYFDYNNAFILFISKSLSNIFPKNSELENQFLDVIASITKNETSSGLIISQEHFKEFQSKLHSFVRSVDEALKIATQNLCKKLSELTEPKREKILGLPNLSLEPIFLDQGLVDDNLFENRLKCVGSIFKEIVSTEQFFHNKALMLTKKIWHLRSTDSFGNFFEALEELGLIDQAFCLMLTHYWEELSKSSGRLIENCAPATNLLNQMESCLIAFSPQIIHSHLKHLKILSGAYIRTDDIVKNCQKKPTTSQKLLDFKRINKTDVIDILIMPVQRAPRYVLLLKELSKQFDSVPIKDSLNARIEYLQRWIESINFMIDPNTVNQ